MAKQPKSAVPTPPVRGQRSPAMTDEERQRKIEYLALKVRDKRQIAARLDQLEREHVEYEQEYTKAHDEVQQLIREVGVLLDDAREGRIHL